MPSRVYSNGAQGVGPEPIYVEVKPRNTHRRTRTPSPSSPKNVRFAPSSQQVISRPLKNHEEGSLRNFDSHAKHCKQCHDPYRVYRHRGQLCAEGHALAQDVALNVFCKDAHVYSKVKDDHKLVRVELGKGYPHAMGLLQSVDYHLRSTGPPVISYDRSYPVAARRTPDHARDHTPKHDRRYDDYSEEEESETAYVEPGHSRRLPPRPVVAPSRDVEAPVERGRKYYKEHRGTRYEEEMRRMEEAGGKRYRVVVRTPEKKKKHREGRDEGRRQFWE